MSTKHIRTASDLARFHCGLEVACPCGHKVTVDGFDVVRACGNVEIAELKRRLRCAECGARGATLSVVEPPERR